MLPKEYKWEKKFSATLCTWHPRKLQFLWECVLLLGTKYKLSMWQSPVSPFFFMFKTAWFTKSMFFMWRNNLNRLIPLKSVKRERERETYSTCAFVAHNLHKLPMQFNVVTKWFSSKLLMYVQVCFCKRRPNT